MTELRASNYVFEGKAGYDRCRSVRVESFERLRLKIILLHNEKLYRYIHITVGEEYEDNT